MLRNERFLLRFMSINSLFLLLSFFSIKALSDTKIIAKEGDSLLKLSRQYGVSLRELMYKNNFNDANKIIEGKVILIPQIRNKNNNKNLTYKVVEGDTLYKIARDYNVDIKDIISINNLENSSFLKANQIILLPIGAMYKKVSNKKDFKLAHRKVFYHQTFQSQEIKDISKLHKLSKEEIISLNKLKNSLEIKPHTKLKIRENNDLGWLQYGSIKIDWSEWRYLNGNYITLAKNKKNKFFYLAISCEKRVLNNTLNNSEWTSWYFPNIDYEFKLIEDYCN